mmetsp:Transcript_55659/g.113766  ORF Transcript_55659/g.113766 Transcript_55659/m.113766 type:complete len:400 (-) Transcript_55659:235-1434(-)
MAVVQHPTQQPDLIYRAHDQFALNTEECMTADLQVLDSCSDGMPVFDHEHLLPSGPTNADGMFVWGHGEGCSIAQATAEQDKPFTEAEIACIMQQALSGLEYLHAKDTCHKNLHLGNLHIDANSGSIKLSGYGVSPKAGRKQAAAPRGYTLFEAPEIRKGGQYTKSTDIWSVGGVALELLIRGTSREAEHSAHRRPCLKDAAKGEQPIFPLGISLDCISFLDDCFQMDASERLSAQELLEHPFIVSGCAELDPVEPSLAGALDELLVISEENRARKPTCRPAGLAALPSKGKLRFSTASHTQRECRSGNCSLCGASRLAKVAASPSIPIVTAQKTVKMAAVLVVEESGVRSPVLSAARTKRGAKAEESSVRPEKPTKRMCNKWFSEGEEMQLSMLGYAT